MVVYHQGLFFLPSARPRGQAGGGGVGAAGGGGGPTAAREEAVGGGAPAGPRGARSGGQAPKVTPGDPETSRGVHLRGLPTADRWGGPYAHEHCVWPEGFLLRATGSIPVADRARARGRSRGGAPPHGAHGFQPSPILQEDERLQAEQAAQRGRVARQRLQDRYLHRLLARVVALDDQLRGGGGWGGVEPFWSRNLWPGNITPTMSGLNSWENYGRKEHWGGWCCR